jgi:hypothetical protein
MDNVTSYKWSFKKKGKVWDFSFFLKFLKGLFFGWGKEEVTSPQPRVVSFSNPLEKGMGMVFFLKGKGPFQGVVSWVAWKGGGWVVSKGRGVVFFPFSPPFLKGVK